MQVSCPECQTRLQLSAAKLPDQPFSIKCPKCAQAFVVTPVSNAEPVAPVPPPPPVPAPAPPAIPPVTAPVAAANSTAATAASTSKGLHSDDSDILETPAAPVAPVAAPAAPQMAVPPAAPMPAPPLATPAAAAPATNPVTNPPATAATEMPAPAQTTQAVPNPAVAPRPMPRPVPRADDDLMGLEASKESPQSNNNLAVGYTQSMPSPVKSDSPHSLITPSVGTSNGGDLLQALAALFASQAGGKQGAVDQTRTRHIVACLAVAEQIRALENIVDNQAYSLIIPNSVDEVTAMLQSGGQMDILLLDPAYQTEQQASAAIMRCVNMLNPARRRRLFVVVISNTFRTLDAQTAFAHGVNLIVNSSDLPNLPIILNESIQSFNNLYRAFNIASGMVPF